jgi:lipopolysaccharide transport system ATP-binding protein
MSSEIAIQLVDIAKEYRLYSRPIDRLKQAIFRDKKYFQAVEAVKPLSVTIRRGETVGIVGRNGSGKSTLLQIIAGTLTPTTGTVAIHGRVAALLELGSGFNPDFTGRENIFLYAALLGLEPEQIKQRFGDIVAFSDIGDFIDQPVRTYSSGMHVRLAFAVAISVDPDILIVDEALAVGDEAFQRKCYSRIENFQAKGGTILFVSHAAAAVTQLCSRAILMDGGELLMDGRPKQVVNQYHRLAFATPERRLEIREELRHFHDMPMAASAPTIETPKIEDRLKNAYDPGMMSRSRVDYDQDGATIVDPHLEDESGERVNLLIRGQRYIYAYRVRFDRPATDVRFGMYCRTVNGLDLAGSPSAGPRETVPHLDAGQQVDVRFSFDCRLLPGSYFLNAGASAMVGDDRRFLHRIVDAVLFRVQPEAGLLMEGLVDLDIMPTVNVLEN